MARYAIHVDDEPGVRVIIGEMLELLGFEVGSAPSVSEGLKLARARKPDLVLLDVMMPEVDGFEGCRLMRELDKTVPIVMVTALDRMADVEKAFAAGANDFIVKPVRLDYFKAKVERALNAAGRKGGAPPA